MKKILLLYLFVLINIVFCGCNNVPEPIMLEAQKYDFTNKYDAEKLKQLSHQSAQYGWYLLLHSEKNKFRVGC